jgi:hypothetical protein
VAVCEVDVRKGENAVRELQAEYGKDRVVFIKTDVSNVAELEGNAETTRMLAIFLRWACQKFKKYDLLSEYCDTRLLKQNFANTKSVSGLCNTVSFCENCVTQDPLFRTLLLKSCLSKLCD